MAPPPLLRPSCKIVQRIQSSAGQLGNRNDCKVKIVRTSCGMLHGQPPLMPKMPISSGANAVKCAIPAKCVNACVQLIVRNISRGCFSMRAPHLQLLLLPLLLLLLLTSLNPPCKLASLPPPSHTHQHTQHAHLHTHAACKSSHTHTHTYNYTEHANKHAPKHTHTHNYT